MVGLKSPLQQGLSEPEFYGVLVFKLRKIVSSADFSEQFREVIMRYKSIEYNFYVMRQSACLVIKPVMGRTVTNVDRTCGPTHLLVFSGNKICLN